MADHYPYVDDQAIAGVAYVNQARCQCGWTGTLGASRDEARQEVLRHSREHYTATWDDVCWSLGIGRWAQ